MGQIFLLLDGVAVCQHMLAEHVKVVEFAQFLAQALQVRIVAGCVDILICQGLLLIEQVLHPFAQVMPGLRVAAALGLDGAIAALLVGARQTTDQQLMVADAQCQ